MMYILIIDKNKELSLKRLKEEMDQIPEHFIETRRDDADKMVFLYRAPYPEMTVDELLDSPLICRLTPPRIIHIN